MKVLNYDPKKRETPRLADVSSAWGNIPTILKDIIDRFNIKTENAIEFGVEYGYSTSALSNYFKDVTGVDIFTGDQHAGYKGDIYDITKSNLDSFDGINLVKQSYQEFIIDENNNKKHYNLAHVDIIHTYEDTFACGEWCLNHSDIVIFHDTLSFHNVFRACSDLASKYNLEFHNYRESHGLGILVKI